MTRFEQHMEKITFNFDYMLRITDTQRSEQFFWNPGRSRSLSNGVSYICCNVINKINSEFNTSFIFSTNGDVLLELLIQNFKIEERTIAYSNAMEIYMYISLTLKQLKHIKEILR